MPLAWDNIIVQQERARDEYLLNKHRKTAEDDYANFIWKQSLEHERLKLNPGIVDSEKMMKTFGVVAGDPRTVTSIDFADVPYSYTTFAIGSAQKPLTADDINSATQKMHSAQEDYQKRFDDVLKFYKGNTNTESGCYRHSEVSESKKRLLKYKLQFHGKFDYTKDPGSCIVCRAIDAGLFKPKK